MTEPATRHDILVPDLGLGERAIIVSSWLARKGATVGVGEQLVELLAGDVLLQLSSEVSGTLKEKCIRAERPVSAGDVLGVIQCPPESC